MLGSQSTVLNACHHMRLSLPMSRCRVDLVANTYSLSESQCTNTGDKTTTTTSDPFELLYKKLFSPPRLCNDIPDS